MSDTDFGTTFRDFEEDEDYTSRIAQAFGNVQSRVQPAANTTRRVGDVTIIPELHQQYRANPTAAVIANVPLFERPEDIDLWNAGNRIDEMVRHQDAAAERADLLSKNKRYEFSQLVLDFVDQNIGVANNNLVGRSDDSLSRLRVTAVPPAQVTFARNDATGPAFGLPTNFPVNQSAAIPLTAEQMQFQADQQLVRDRAEQEYVYERQVSNALQQVGVSGVFKFAPNVQNGVGRALAVLRKKNPTKFANATIDQFLETDDVMNFIVTLTGLHIAIQEIINARRYYHDKDTDRRTKEINRLANDMNRELKLEDGFYVIMNGDEIEEEKINTAKRIRLAKTGRRFG